MTSYMNERQVRSAAHKAAASHQVVIELRSGQGNDLAHSINELIDQLALTPGCDRYALDAHPVAPRTWLIQGDWDCQVAMNEHFQSQPLQALLEHLQLMNLFRMEFSCRVTDASSFTGL